MRLDAMVNAACDVLEFYSEWLPSPLVFHFKFAAFRGRVRHVLSQNK